MAPSPVHAALLCALFDVAAGHATLLKPQPRSGVAGDANAATDQPPYQSPVSEKLKHKLPKFAGKIEYRDTEMWSIKLPLDKFDALETANSGCGGEANRDPGMQPVKVAYKPGQEVRVEWELSLAHYPLDDTGVRIALHYDESSSFAQNVLAGGIKRSKEDELDFLPVSAESEPPGLGGSVGKRTVTMPEQLCDHCVLQFAAVQYQNDGPGGLYLSCADVAITADGELPSPSPKAQAALRSEPEARGGGSRLAAPLAALAVVGAVVAAVRLRSSRRYEELAEAPQSGASQWAAA